MSVVDVAAAFRTLTKPVGDVDELTFATLPLGATKHRLGKDSDAAPALLLKVRHGTNENTAPIVLQHLSVLPKVRCLVVDPGASSPPEEETFTVVRCLSPDPSLRQYFVRVADAAVAELGPNPTTAEVNSSLFRLAELFRAFEAPPTRTVQGLWAELAVIAWSSRPDDLCQAWHAHPAEGFDFSAGADRLEVKSFSGHARVHSFSMAQLSSSPGVRTLIASLHVARSSGGASIPDLLDCIRRRPTSIESMGKLQLVVARSLGDAAANALSISFDLQLARDSLRFFDPDFVPAIRPPLPSGVLNVHFESMLEETSALSLTDVERYSGLAAAARPLT